MKNVLLLLAGWLVAATALPASGADQTAVNPQLLPPATQIYKNPGDRDLKITMTFPKNWRPQDHRPAIVFFYNGGWQPGATNNQFSEQADYFSRRGMVCARADYREKAKEGPTSAKCIEDVFSAVRWLRKNSGTLGIDPARIAAGGGSGSIHLAASALYADEIHAKDDDLKISAGVGALFLFDTDLDVLDPAMMQRLLAGAGSPEHRQHFPATICFYGSRDALRPFMDDFVARASKAGLPIESFVEDDGLHGAFKYSPWLEKTTERIDLALRKIGYLSDEPQAKLPSKSKLAGVDERIVKTQERWLERHQEIEKSRAAAAPPITAPEPPHAVTPQAAAPSVKAPPVSEKPAVSAVSVPSKDWDSNKDGKISKAEFKAPAALFDHLDTDGDGFLSGKELAKLDQKLQVEKTDDADWVVPPEHAYHGVEHKTYHSAAMKTDVGYNIYLPDEYQTSHKRYPVIYHLHGSGGNESSQVNLAEVYQKAIAEHRMCPVIIVFANGGRRSYYCDGANGKVLAETTIIHELIPYIDATYRTIPERACRVIHGFSMGGFGAMRLGAKYPELFCAVLSFGGGMASPGSVHMGFLRHILGDDDRLIAENNPADLVIKNKTAMAGMAYWLFTGTKDIAREDSEWAHHFLSDQHVPHRFEVSEGVGHTVNKHYALFGDEIYKMLQTHFATSEAFVKSAE